MSVLIFGAGAKDAVVTYQGACSTGRELSKASSLKTGVGVFVVSALCLVLCSSPLYLQL